MKNLWILFFKKKAEELVARAREIFDQFDTNHNGSIEASELKEVFKQFDIDLADETVDNMVILFYVKFGIVKFTVLRVLNYKKILFFRVFSKKFLIFSGN